MFKITLYGKTLVGNNEDSWQLTSRIWFENGTGNGYGAVYTGYSNGFPQGGMNTAGLVFDGFTVYPRKLKDAHDKKKITDPTAFVKQIMQSCGSVEEVQAFAGQYDRSYFNNGMFLFVDKTGNYLVIEADTMIAGADEKYVLANFCPSLTPDPETVTIGRYRRGKAFLGHYADTSIAFCTAAMDTMHECRPGLGDGTLYTTIYDTENGRSPPVLLPRLQE
jgi:hypothetical protein